MKRLWLIQAIGNALLFWGAFTWLGISDSRTSKLVETAVCGLVLLVAWLWLQNATFAYFSDRALGVGGAFLKAVKTLPLFTLVVLVFALLFWGLGKLDAPFAKAGQWTASWLTFHLRKPIKPTTWVRIYAWLLWVVKWIALPAILLPIAAGAASGAGIFRRARLLFWLQCALALAIGYYLPELLKGWVPKLSGTTMQVVSFTLRFGVAYILMVSAWVAVVERSARGRGTAITK